MVTILYKWLLLVSPFLSASVFTLSEAPRKEAHQPHPFYISVTEISQNAKEQTLEISCKLFAEDLEESLKKNYKVALDLTLEKDRARLQQLIPDYITHHFSVVLNGKPQRLTFVGYETEKESAYCYFQVNQVAAVKTLQVENSILYDFNDTQINIMHVTANGTRKSTRVNYPDKDAEFQF